MLLKASPLLLAALGAMVIFNVASASVAAPAVPDKAEVIFADDFENGKADGWSGVTVTTEGADSKSALAVADAGLIAKRTVSFTSTAQTYLTFRYLAGECYSLSVQFADKTLGDNFKTFITPIQRGSWQSVTFNITADIQGCSRHEAGIKAGDKLEGVTIWPMDKLAGASLLIDDVAIYTMTPDARAAKAVNELEQKLAAFNSKPGVDGVAAKQEIEWAQDLTKQILAALKSPAPETIDEPEEKAASGINQLTRRQLLNQVKGLLGEPSLSYIVGTESPLVRVTWQNPSMLSYGQVAAKAELAAGGHEYENLQLLVTPVQKDLENVQLELGDLKGPTGTIEKKHLQWRLVKDVKSKPSYGYPRSLHGWKPDPLLPAEPFNVKVGQVQPIWLTAHVPPDAASGDYAGTVTVKPANAPPWPLELKLHVWNYRLPLRGRFRHMCQFLPQSNDKRRENYELLMKYRLSPTAQYSTRMCTPAAEDVQFCLDRGITTFVAGNHPKDTINDAIVQPYYEALKQAGCIDLAVIYIGDEGTSPDVLAGYRRKAAYVKSKYPGLRAMVGGSTPRKELNGFIDVWDPIMSMTAAPGSGYEFNAAAVAQRKALGEEFLWYMAGVRPPYPSIELDPPAPSLRMFPWITWKCGIGGWEVYGTQGGWEKENNKTWPKTTWDTYTWRTYNGSGQFFYPGPDGVPLASIRIENARDGIEDYETLGLLSDALEFLAANRPAGIDDAAIAAAKELVAVPKAMVATQWDWSRDPVVIDKCKVELSGSLDKFVTVIGRGEFDRYVQRRAEERRKANNDSYQKRLEEFLATQGRGPTTTTTMPTSAATGAQGKE